MFLEFCTLVEFLMDSMRRRWKVSFLVSCEFGLIRYTILPVLFRIIIIFFVNLCDFAGFFVQFGAIKRLRIARNKKVGILDQYLRFSLSSYFISCVFSFTSFKIWYRFTHLA